MTKFISIPLASLLLVTTITLAEEVDPIVALLGGATTTSSDTNSSTTTTDNTSVPIDTTEEIVTIPATKEEVGALYVANFDRAPDSDGLNYWVDSKDPIENIASSFYDQQETKELYPEGYSNADFINEVYNNLFGREPDSEGFDYWLDALDSGSVSKAVFILSVLNGAQGDDKVIMEKKRDAGLEFAASGSNDYEKSKEVIRAIITTTTTTTTNTTTITNSYNSENTVTIDGNNNSVSIRSVNVMDI